MLWSFCVLLACQAIGEAIHVSTSVSVPGTVLGIAVLTVLLASRGPRQPALPAADALLPYLGLMFVPPGVMAVLRMRTLPEAWLPVAVAIVVSSGLALLVAGRLAQALLNRSPGRFGRLGHPRGARS